MAGKKRAVSGQGSVYKEEKPERRTKWVAERFVRLPDGQKRRIRARARTQQEAVEELERKIVQAKRANPAADKLTVDEYMKRWLEHKGTTVRASTLFHYEQDHRLYIRPALGSVRLSRLTPYQVQRLLTSIQADEKHAMADRVRRTLKQAMRQAVDWDLLNVNPMSKLAPIRKRPVKRGVWTPAQVETFLTASAGTPYHLVFVLALATGMRKGEILGLRWGDIEGQRIHVRRTQSRKAEGGVAAPKTQSGERSIPISRGVAAALVAARNGAADDAQVFPGRRRGARYTSQRTISQHLTDLSRAASVPEIRFHDLRRTYATMLARDGTHPRVIQQLLGHSTPTLAMTIYTDVLAEQEERAVIELPGGSVGGNQVERGHTVAATERADSAAGEADPDE